jgi:hypothetical protein
MKSKDFNKRKWVTSLMALSFIGLPVSGVMLHLARHAASAELIHVWMIVHNSLGLLFLLSGCMHIVFNFKSIRRY